MDLAAADAKPQFADRLLLIEDDENDVFQFQRMLRRVDAKLGLDVVTDGEAAIHWLSEKIAELHHGQQTLPRAIFVDLRLPGLRGSEVLRWIREQAVLDPVLVVVCSGSADLRDIAEAERLRADLYLTKFPPQEQFAALLKVHDPRLLRVESVRAAVLPQ